MAEHRSGHGGTRRRRRCAADSRGPGAFARIPAWPRVAARAAALAACAALCTLAGCASTQQELPKAPRPARIARALPPAPPPKPQTPRRPAAPPQQLAPAAPPKPSFPFRDAVAVQTLLERRNLSCNCADGVIGPRTRAAVSAWQKRCGLPVTGELDAATLASFGPLDAAFTTHTVTAAEVEALTPVPTTWVGKSQVAQLGYETIVEALAEKYHTAEKTLRELNPDARWPTPKAGTVLVVPDPHPSKVSAATRLSISLGGKVIRVYGTNDTLLAQFPCSIARDKAKRPKGELHIINCAANPQYYFDPALFADDAEAASIRRKLVIPPGPNNPVGVAWIGLSLPGYGIHGTQHPEDIGKTESHGCFRLANWNVEKLVKMISIGMPVDVDD